MPIIETGKALVERMTGWARPSKEDLSKAVRARKPHQFMFEDDGVILKSSDLAIDHLQVTDPPFAGDRPRRDLRRPVRL